LYIFTENTSSRCGEEYFPTDTSDKKKNEFTKDKSRYESQDFENFFDYIFHATVQFAVKMNVAPLKETPS
jgi:hypothetical protein